MEERIKQRMVGAAVLVALAVIFIPIILEGPEEEFGPWGTKLPKPPAAGALSDIEPLVLPEHGATEPVHRIVLDVDPSRMAEKKANQEATAENQAVVTTTSIPDNQESKPATGSSVADKGLQSWVVQVGSFNDKQKALGLQSRLQVKGYTAFVEPLSAEPGSMYRVRVGPELKRADAQLIRDRIASEMNLDGMVTSYP